MILGGAHRRLIAPPSSPIGVCFLGSSSIFLFSPKGRSLIFGGRSSNTHRRPLIDPSSLRRARKNHDRSGFCREMFSAFGIGSEPNTTSRQIYNLVDSRKKRCTELAVPHPQCTHQMPTT